MTRRGTIATLLLVAATAALATVPAAPAPAAGCRGQGNADAAPAVQERAMLCLVNKARKARGLGPLDAVGSLARAAGRKSGDILRCDEFSHEACGREFTYWIERVGYRACSAAENIAWGTGALGTPRSIFRAWMRSPGHRRNILGDYEDIGIGLRIGELEGTRGAHVWTQQFGSRNC
ncbi:MAG TPA: CAP domain-containing protein [Solirubrobacterales bacterium]|nr:CAP domain-containing protein [Solirubrobacterales bacterium]